MFKFILLTIIAVFLSVFAVLKMRYAFRLSRGRFGHLMVAAVALGLAIWSAFGAHFAWPI